MKRQIIKICEINDYITASKEIQDYLDEGYTVVHMTQSGSGSMTAQSHMLTVVLELDTP